MNVKEKAEAHIPLELKKNVSDLEHLDLSLEILEEVDTTKEGKEYTYSYVLIDDIKHRIAIGVIESIQAILKVKPKTQKVKVIKTGEGLNTKYQTIPL